MIDERKPFRTHPRGARLSRWAAPDGFALRRMDWPVGAGRRARGSLLFAGGRGDFIEKYLEAYRDWRAAGWNVTAFDWRGQGHSRGDIVRGNMESFDPLVDDLEALIADWRGVNPGPHAAIGHSMGGHMLLRAIVERRVDLDAAVLVAPMIGVNTGPVPAFLAPLVARAMCRLGFGGKAMWKTPRVLARPGSQRQHYLTGRARSRYEDELWWWKQDKGLSLGAPSWTWLCAAFRSAAASFTNKRLAGVDLPILILGAARDRLVRPSEIRRIAAHIPRAELEIYPTVAHELLRAEDKTRDAALARIAAFLDEHAR